MTKNEYLSSLGRGGMGSIPRGVGAPPPPGTHSSRGKLMCIKVRMLDDTIAVFHLGHKAVGQTLMDEVSRHLNLLERDYFGLVFVDCTGLQCWLEMEKPILRQIANTRADAKFYLIVKFYTPNPVDLEEEYTRYLFTLQIRRDLATGELVCSEVTAALLVAYLVQSDCGDFSEEDYPDAHYLNNSRFVPNQTFAFQELVRSNHRRLIGMSPGESDLALLEVARRCEFYGVKLHPAKDVEGADASLAAFHGGMKVYHQMHCVSTFSWAKVRKLSFKRKKLLIKLHPDASQFYKETIEFFFDTRNECKSFWKKCVEQHAFFRCPTAEMPKREARKEGKTRKGKAPFRGRTHKELIDYVREHHKRREPFTRPLRSATTQRSTYCASYVSGYVSDPGTARSLPTLRDARDSNQGALDARSSRKQRSSRGVSMGDKAASDVESPYGNHSHGCPRHGPRETLPPPTDNMSLSLPNVLDDEPDAPPPKSASGESFFPAPPPKEDDNISHDSYRVEEEEEKPSISTFAPPDGGYAVLERPPPPREFPLPSPLVLSSPLEGIRVSTPVDSRAPILTSSGALLLKPRVIGFAPKEERTRVIPVSSPPLPVPSTTTVSSTPSTTATSRPLAGRVITKEQLVITPLGVAERPRPVPPPKPRLDSSLSSPILDAEGTLVGKQRPALISVKSVDNPDVEKFHLFNSSIPYTLTLRTVPSDEYSTSSLGREGRGMTDSLAVARRKSVDMVPRKRLPSPASFSSQDHSITATTPETGDLFEYVLRRRSMSHERSALRGKRTDPRRQTQPVRFDLPPSPSGPPSTRTSAPALPLEDDDALSEGRSLHEDMERLEATALSLSSLERPQEESPPEELPPPPPSLSTFKPDKKTPPQPPPKPITNVVSIRTMLMEREITMRREEGGRGEGRREEATPSTKTTQGGLQWTDF